MITATRSEALRVNLELDKAQADKFKGEIEGLCKFLPGFPMADGDNLKVAYEFRLDYFGDVVKNFKRLRTILSDPTVIRKIGVVELNYGESLIVQLLDEIREVQKSL